MTIGYWTPSSQQPTPAEIPDDRRHRQLAPDVAAEDRAQGVLDEAHPLPVPRRHQLGEGRSNPRAVDHEPERQEQDEGGVGRDAGHQLDVADRLDDDLLELALGRPGEVGADLVGWGQGDPEAGCGRVDTTQQIVEVGRQPATEAV